MPAKKQTQAETNAWDLVEKGSTTTIPFLNFKSGQKAEIKILGEPFRFYKKYLPGLKKNIISQEKFEGAAKRFAVNVLDLNDNTVKVWETSVTNMSLLKEVKDDMGLDNVSITIKRIGSTKDDTTYTVYPKVMTKKIEAKYELFDLSKVFADRNLDLLRSANVTQTYDAGVPVVDGTTEEANEEYNPLDETEE